MTYRLFVIETRRSVGLWFVPLLLIMAWLLYQGTPLAQSLARQWGESSVVLRGSLHLLGPFAGGIAAWMASRERRRGVDELLDTTSRPAFHRSAATLAGTALWSAATYLAAGVYILGATYLQATWGGLYLWPLVVGLLGIGAHSAVGYAVASYLPYRFTPPFIAVTLFAVQGWIGGSRDWLGYLSPPKDMGTDIWRVTGFEPGPYQSLFLLGLTFVALAALALRGQVGRGRWVLLLPATALTLVGVLGLYLTAPRWNMEQQGYFDYRGRPLTDAAALISYTPVCSDDPLPVCVHPAYTRLLPQTAQMVNRLAAPLIGLPGMYHRVEGRAVIPREPDGILDYQPITQVGADRYEPYNLVRTLVYDSSVPQGDGSLDESQGAISTWLLRSAAYRPQCRAVSVQESWGDNFTARSCAAAQRFERLGPTGQRRWLESNFAALREGNIRLEDLP